MIEDKEIARKQFNNITKELDLKHTFSFDEVWDGMLKQRYRKNVVTFEGAMTQHPGCVTGKDVDILNPLKHSFADGCYVREIFNPKGELIVTKIHKVSHPYFLMQGDMSMMTENGPRRIRAPYHGITPAGTKRIIYTHENCVFVTVHVTKETDLDKIEDEVIAKGFDEINEIELKNLKEELCLS